jgi:integrase
VERDRNPLYRMPKFPVVKYELGWRKIVDKPTQHLILEEIKRISYHINPKVYVGCLWLSTYPSIRPIELLHIAEGDFNFDPPQVNIRYNKEAKPKVVPMLQEDIEAVRSFPKALPHLPFFRHVAGIKGVKAGEPFGEKYLYKWWIKACKNLGIEGVDLYGGTKHSTVTAMSNELGYGRAKQATMHTTNKAFERYLIADPESIRNAYAKARGIDKGLITFPGSKKAAK